MLANLKIYNRLLFYLCKIKKRNKIFNLKLHSTNLNLHEATWEKEEKNLKSKKI